MALSPQERSRRMRLNMLMAMSYAVAGRSTFTPLSLFSAGEQGAWYDPSDFSTMFQDSAGTTPVTAVEQPVGLILDKSKSLAVGAENVVNGAMTANLTSWTAVNDAGSTAVASASGAVLTSASGVSFARLRQTVPAVSGTWYKISFTLVSGSLNFDVWGTGYGSGSLIQQLNYTTTGVRTYIVAATSANLYVQISSSASSTVTVTGISVTSLAGNHASQSTSTSRPVLSARVNLLTYTEQFDNAAWTKSNTTISQNVETAPNGTLTADGVIGTAGAVSVTGAYQSNSDNAIKTLSIYAKAGSKSWIRLYGTNLTFSAFFNLSNGTVGTLVGSPVGAGIESVGNGWYRCYLTFNHTTGATSNLVGFYFTNGDATNNSSGDGSTVLGYVWGADLRSATAGSSLPAYQRVGAATAGTSSAAGTGDYDTTGFPLYLSFDGTDDFLVTGTINPGSVDKAQVFAGVRKLSDAAAAVVAELSVNRNTNNGAFALVAPGAAAANYAFGSKGTNDSFQSVTTYTAPITNVVTGIGDIANDVNIIRVNGTEVASASIDQGTGNFLSYAMYIGRRGGTTLPFNGRIYGLIVRFSAANLSGADISRTETWMNTKTGAY